jgi:DNA-directed RNA polymerase subunit RPC12/RpoP
MINTIKNSFAMKGADHPGGPGAGKANPSANANDVPVACADCPNCGEHIIVGRVASACTSLESRREHDLKCAKCGRQFKVAEHDLRARAKKREDVEAAAGGAIDSLPEMK